MAVACGTKLAEDDFTTVRDDCIWDEQEVLDYLSLINVEIVYNYGSI